MEALEFLKEERRMCASFDAMCVKCPLGDTGCCVIVGDTDRELENEVAAVGQWSKEHPIKTRKTRKTRQSVFLEQWPNAEVFADGILDFCPQELDKCYPCQSTDIEMRCQSCRREFWTREVE